jgi:hypothetical protein
MKLRFMMAAVLVLSGIGLWARGGASPTAAMAAPDSAQIAVSESDYTYVGTKKCKSCHLDVHKSWEKTKMGTAFETLKPGHAREAKLSFGFDADKDYTADATCLPCHTTGFGKPGGYEIPADKRAARKMKARQGVGCESCHGPGSEYVEIFTEIDTRACARRATTTRARRSTPRSRSTTRSTWPRTRPGPRARRASFTSTSPSS